MSFRRSLKNFLKNYSVAVIKVREATSNDPWGPSSSLMLEIADLTYHAASLSEIMSVLWQRLNDQGKKWRHVYKSLTLLDHLIKNGSEKVIHQCREGLFNIQTLKEFQYVDEAGRDQGFHVREKSRQVLALLMDDVLLNRERRTARRTRQRMLQTVNLNHISTCTDQFLPLSSLHTGEELHVAHSESANSSKQRTLEREQSLLQTQGMRVLQAQKPEDIEKEACVQDLISFSEVKPAPPSVKIKARPVSCLPTPAAASLLRATLVPPTANLPQQKALPLHQCANDLGRLIVVARYPGAVHNSFILRQSGLFENFEGNLYGDGGLVVVPVPSTVYRPSFLLSNTASLDVGGFQTGFKPRRSIPFDMPGCSGMYATIPQVNTPSGTAPFVTSSMDTGIPMMASSAAVPEFYNPLFCSSAVLNSKNPFL
ncbi:ENTH domain-containing protein 1 isoform X1 [Rhinatrema bivittatum]|uniref:ENTH domain-containing protein 1 isoform X1 n=1 Tax=Rhinatrema bivittatum TaxID=194408 RepID=UPI0011271B5C|nr:ENTH domain-containing protein 1 isoform X1 [Rhinatrema bivittatum]XP_029446033.1 ENTH domain-containing protein 1 isoform X1 [Rhinatrema bivittatum]XP_029446035.1 ENTH domain-containing protein 1 isoform X1 [Rhinatrema bivittatum]